jgi:hypothetical protein
MSYQPDQPTPAPDSPVWYLANIAETIRSRSPYDGKRGTVWTADGRAFYSELSQIRDRAPDRLTIMLPGTLTRDGAERSYTPSLEVQLHRWDYFHRDEDPREGCHVRVFPPEMPPAARETIRDAVAQAVRDALSALSPAVTGGPVLADPESSVDLFDAIYREAAREHAQHEANRYRESAARDLERAEAIEARLADPLHVPYINR